ncbi:MAG TPA: phospholipid carrier-dependent glycosyltransferase [Pyrinomonadaceae bacterium]|jgi:4-amino-4-deoxy-L-arabinose transferase-like glycosyltransferase|nr:phospholipid carrier-dependent glycosyltransferase [Pyrinomonadaceae bacterium]
MNILQPTNLAKRGFALLLLATALSYFYGLGRAPLLGADEPRYAQVAREMFERGDLVTPTLGGGAWFEKPALVYWSEMAGFRAFGVSEWSARLGAALAGWLTVLFVGWLCGRVEARAGGESRGLRLACAGVAASSAGLIVFSRAVNFDIFLTAAVALSLACYFVAGLEGDAVRRRLLLAGFYAGAGAALLSKGLVGVVLPVGVVGLYSLMRREFPPEWKSALWGVPLMLLVAATWYVPVTMGHGRVFVEEFFVKHHFARFVSDKYHHPQAFYFYLLILPLLQLPWTPFLFVALRNQWLALRRPRPRADDGADDPSLRLRLYAVAWLVVPVAFFSLSRSKLPGYILPALPGAALLAGAELRRFAAGEGTWRAMRATGFILLAAAAAAFAFPVRAGRISWGGALAATAPLALAGAWAALGRGARARAAGVVVGASLLAAMIAAGCVLAGVVRRESVRDLLRLADGRGYAGAPVLNLYTVERSSEFYAAGRLVYDDAGEPRMFDGISLVTDFADERRAPVLVIIPVKHASQLAWLGAARAELIGENGANALFVVRDAAR